jgi:dCMP deaminase
MTREKKTTRGKTGAVEDTRIPWDQFWLNLAYYVAMRSPDERTHVGAVVVGKDNTLLAIGYNGFCRGQDDTNKRRQEPDEKYYFFEHAERNCIYSAAKNGICLDGATMYTSGVPCTDCARGIAQAGIKMVVTDKNWENKQRQKWLESALRSRQILKETGVELIQIPLRRPLLQIKSWQIGAPLEVDQPT